MNLKKTIQAAPFLLLGLAALAGCAAPASALEAPSKEVDSMLIAAEENKWDQFASGGMDMDIDQFADDFINIGYYPTGILRQTRAEAFAPPSDPSLAPPPMEGMIDLDEFLVIHPTGESAVVTYKVTAPFATMYVSSVWALREGEWKTVFYQATPLFSTETKIAAADAVTGLFSGSYGTPTSISGQDVLLLNPDGTYAVDSGGTGQYGTTGTFSVTDGTITFTDDERNDVPACKGDQRSGSYSYTFTGKTLILTSIDDACQGRIRYFAGRTWEK